MCLPTTNDFLKVTLEQFFLHCDDLGESSIPQKDDLLSYLAWSNNRKFDAASCYKSMKSRMAPKDPDLPHFNFNHWESKIFCRRLNLLASNNRAYEIATKKNPSISHLEDFSKIDPCFSTLYPIKLFLIAHIEMAPGYRGMLPFGREVVKYYNTLYPDEGYIGGTPSFKDHIHLRDLSNRKAILMGVPSITINHLMYQFGRLLNESPKKNTPDINSMLD